MAVQKLMTLWSFLDSFRFNQPYAQAKIAAGQSAEEAGILREVLILHLAGSEICKLSTFLQEMGPSAQQ